MAIVGEAFIVIKPMTAGFEGAVTRDLQKLDRAAGSAGSRAGKQFSSSFVKNMGSLGISPDFASKIESQGKALYALQASGLAVGTAISEALGSVSALVGGVVALGSAVLSAAPAVVALGAGFVDLAIGAGVAKLAFSGITKAVTALNKQKINATKDTTSQNRRVEDSEKSLAKVIKDNKEGLVKAQQALDSANLKVTKSQESLTRALKDGQEQLQQIGFDAEDAALAEKRAGLDLEKARENLARVQDLPPNNRARKEAELAYAEAELNLRRAKDKNSDLAKEQERLAKTGVDGLDSVISAREAAAQADQNLADVKQSNDKDAIAMAQKQADAELALKRAQDDLAKAKSGKTNGPDPLAGLTASQKTFATFISGLKPEFDKLKEAAASSLLPPLQTAITTIVDKAFPTLKTGISQVGTSLGNASIKFADAFSSKINLDKLSTVFENAATAIEKIGGIGGNLWGIFLSVLQAVDPLLQKFLGWLEKGTKNLDDKLNADPKKLQAFFDEAGRVAGEVGNIIGNVAKGLGNIIKANTGPGTGGQIMLDYFKDITKTFKDFSGSKEGQSTLKSYFAGAAENTKSILSNVGKFVKEILKLGDDPNIKKFWDTIGKAAEPFGSILKKTNEGAPSMASLLVTITKIIDALTNTSTIKTFFGTFDFLAKIVLAILNNKLIKKIMDFTAPFHGIALALTVVGLLFSQFGAGLLFLVLKPLSMLMKLFKVFKVVIEVFRIAWMLLTIAFEANPIGVIVVALVALVAVFVLLYKKNEAFRELVQKVWAAIKDAIGSVIDFLVNLFSSMWDGLKTGLEATWTGIKIIWDIIVKGVTIFIDAVIAVIKFVWDVLKTGLELVWTGVKFVWDLVVAGVKLYIAAVIAVIKFVWDILKTGLDLVWTGIKFIWDLIVTGVKAYISTVTTIISTIWNFLKTGLDTAWNGAKAVWDTIVAFISGLGTKISKAASGMWDGLKSGLGTVINWIISALNGAIGAINLLLKGLKFATFGKVDFVISPIPPVALARGGVVQPTQGGTLARIGEAGRPERVEPLDPDGLSKRDKAMIQMLAGNQGGSGATINVYPSQGMDENELAAIISRKIAFQMRGGAIA